MGSNAADGETASRRDGEESFEPLLRLLGLGVRGGNVLMGVDGLRTALQHDEVICVVLASDLSERAMEKVGRLAIGKGLPVLAGPDAATLGDRLGRPPVQAVGVKDRALADGVVRAARPWASGGTIG
ncbi:MAG TPA: ribosomal L7Ae/L30e/S12e/Gadd45 family protein [Gemmatimonadales bacterium]|nr:ribosomal L7Ae/L30e/S12e/Gadd45 family protein [Gemmatimonadales bacterium]